jgi:hypothetical protein
MNHLGSRAGGAHLLLQAGYQAQGHDRSPVASRCQWLLAAVSMLAILLCPGGLLASQVPGDKPAGPALRYDPSWAEHRFSVNGLYPLWEASGHTLGLGGAHIGTSHIQVGLGKRIQVGLRPVPYPFGAPNLHGRFGVLTKEGFHLAFQGEVMVLLPGAGNSFASSNFKSRINNWAKTYVVVPVSLAASWQPLKWLQLNQSLTVMGVFGLTEPSGRVTLGYFVNLELVPLRRHGFVAHFGEVGFWDHDFVVIGASYRLNFRAFELRLGYFYRRSADGGQGAPAFSASFRM